MPYTVKLKDKKQVAVGTEAFIFEKPAGFEFKGGQSIDMTLVNPPETNAEGNTRAFSISAAPYEENLMIATRMRDTAFKRVLGKMELGVEVQIDGPFGSMTLHNNIEKPAVLMAGGIGITPFHSMVKDAAFRKLSHKIFLFYSNRRPEDAAFLNELQALEKENPNYNLIATMTEMEKSVLPWVGERGYLTKEMIMSYVKDLSKPIYYLAGPPQMVLAMRKILDDAGVDSDNVRSEEFSGY